MAEDGRESRKKGKKKEAEAGTVAIRIIAGLLSLLLALVSIGGLLGGAGRGGLFLFHGVWLLFGAGYIIFPVGLGTLGVFLLAGKRPETTVRQWVTLSVGLLASLAFLSIVSGSTLLGGYIGQGIAAPLVAVFDTLFAGLILFFALIGSFVIFFDQNPRIFLEHVQQLVRAIRTLKLSKSAQPEENDQQEPVQYQEPEPTPAATSNTAPEPEPADDFVPIQKKRKSGRYVPPPLSLLERDHGKANVGDVKANTNIIRRTLANFGIEVEMDEVTTGPTVTRYALKPAQGVKLSRIAGLQNDLALALAAHPIRMELPIPGKSLVGIEIPNKTKATVGLASLLSDPSFASNERPLVAAIGRNISGKPVLKSIAKMPHLLIAGTTGSGKSVTIHAIIASLLYKHGPDDLRFIFVDPKR
ncbi:MAG TPA: DNA translocase FtsK, partial [Candidatus Paceibacterota bacterium]|nr:DNA translocase FtsK [Candidatus Paceibacterota bacterium]